MRDTSAEQEGDTHRTGNGALQRAEQGVHGHYDETGSIGKRYRREDEIGTPYCITFDFNTVGTETDEADHCVTIRERDSMQQVRIPISEVKDYIAERIKF